MRVYLSPMEVIMKFISEIELLTSSHYFYLSFNLLSDLEEILSYFCEHLSRGYVRFDRVSCRYYLITALSSSYMWTFDLGWFEYSCMVSQNDIGPFIIKPDLLNDSLIYAWKSKCNRLSFIYWITALMNQTKKPNLFHQKIKNDKLLSKGYRIIMRICTWWRCKYLLLSKSVDVTH